MIDSDLLKEFPVEIQEQFKVSVIGIVSTQILQRQIDRHARQLIADVRTNQTDEQLLERIKISRSQIAVLTAILDYGSQYLKE